MEEGKGVLSGRVGENPHSVRQQYKGGGDRGSGVT